MSRSARFVVLPAAALIAATTLAGCGGDAPVARESPSPAVSDTTSSSASTSSEPSASVSETVQSLPAPYIDRAVWVETEVGPSLQVVPTPSGRQTQGEHDAAAAWAEVLKLDPSADTPGMQAQFDCHWKFARLVEPNKPSWNLEPGRPVVSESEMISARCNPGFAEE